MKGVRFWVVADIHAGHKEIIRYETRPEDFESLVLKNWNNLVTDDDIVINLGDTWLGNVESWDNYIRPLKGRKVLVRGNHDKESITHYLRNGTDFICDSFSLKIYGYNILFSHRPLPKEEIVTHDFNIHGHLHTKSHRDYDEKTDKHILFSLEKEKYKPVLLQKFIGNHIKNLKNLC